MALPIQLRGQPADEEERSGTEPRRVLDLKRLDFHQVMISRGMIEELRQRDAEVHQAHPIQVTEDDAVFCFVLRRLDQLHLLIELAPGLAVVNDPIDPGPKLRIERSAKLLLPPEIERQIGVELREDDIGQETALVPPEKKGKLLGTDLLAAGAADVAMRADPGVHAIFG